MQSLVFKMVFRIFPYQLAWCQNTVTMVKWRDAVSYCFAGLLLTTYRSAVDAGQTMIRLWYIYNLKKHNSAITM